MPKHVGHDPSTGLPNALLLHDRLGQALAHGRRRNGLLALIRIDLDDAAAAEGFAERLLEEAATRLQAVVRASDTIGRIGRDVFAMILPDLSGLTAAGVVADKVLAALEQEFAIDGERLALRVSLGIAMFPTHGDSAEALLHRAGIAAARAATEGTRLQWFDGSDDVQGPPRDLARELGAAIDQGQLSLVYQPLIGFGQEWVVGLEALLRWDHPILGPIEPEAFVGLAEANGQIGRIGKWVLFEACAAAARWPARPVPIRVAVNLSTAQMVADDLPQVVARALEHAGLPAPRLELELTERSLMDGGERLLAVLGRLRALGVSLALDDFGTGHASLRHLACLPLDALKIDRSFVTRLDDRAHHAIVHSVIELAHRMRLRVTAEGVETASQLAALRALDCDEVQGHIYGKPLRATAVPRWLRARADRQRAGSRPPAKRRPGG